MKANPGGQIDTKSVVGRDQLIETLWEILEMQSVVITAERRIGKTTVIKKMRDEHRAGWVPVFQDLESCHTASEFAMAVYREIHHFLGKRGRATRRVKELFTALGGTEIGGLFKLPEKAASAWKDVLTKSVEDLMHENDESGDRLLFLWDEVPFMLDNIRKREGEQVAMEVLDLLRALRQTHAGLRMVITGSIGLHHVLTALKDKQYANAPTNDMAPVDVPPLTVPDATALAHQLLAGEGLKADEPQKMAEIIAIEADCFPFYIHHIVRALKVRVLSADQHSIARLVSQQLVDDGDPWELLHYRERIRIYYPEDQKTVLLILDQLAVADRSRSVDELLAGLKGSSTFDDRDRLLRLLGLMVRDHYLNRDESGRYAFRFPLIRRWWELNRGL